MKRGKYRHERAQEAAKAFGVATPAAFAKLLKENPQTGYKWYHGQTVNISAADLFYMADKLNVNPRWLMTLSDERARVEALGPDEQSAVELFKALRALPDQGWLEEWMRAGYKTLERLDAKPSVLIPFPGKMPVKA